MVLTSQEIKLVESSIKKYSSKMNAKLIIDLTDLCIEPSEGGLDSQVSVWAQGTPGLLLEELNEHGRGTYTLTTQYRKFFEEYLCMPELTNFKISDELKPLDR